MPVLDANALKCDRKGLAFLKAVLSNRSTDKAAPSKSDTPSPSRTSAPPPTQLNR